MTAPGLPIADRFLLHVEKAGDCWLWTGTTRDDGYGVIRIEGRTLRAHRVAYELHVGPIPEDRPHLDHLCRVRNCVNPAHLEPVTQKENNARVPRPTHCPQGHEFTPENTAHRTCAGVTSRTCRTCERTRAAAARLAKASA